VFHHAELYFARKGGDAGALATNVGPENGDTAMLPFGHLPAPARRPLSADPKRTLIVDDEHVLGHPRGNSSSSKAALAMAKCSSLSKRPKPDRSIAASKRLRGAGAGDCSRWQYREPGNFDDGSRKTETPPLRPILVEVHPSPPPRRPHRPARASEEPGDCSSRPDAFGVLMWPPISRN